MNLYKQCTTKPYYFLVTNTTLASYHPLHFKKNLLERMYKLIITIDDKIREKKMPYNINTKTVIRSV